MDKSIWVEAIKENIMEKAGCYFMASEVGVRCPMQANSVSNIKIKKTCKSKEQNALTYKVGDCIIGDGRGILRSNIENTD